MRRFEHARAMMIMALLAAFLSRAGANAQPPTPERVASTGWHYVVLNAPTRPRAALMLFPGYGGSASDFLPGGSSPTTLGRRLASAGVLTVAISPAPNPRLYFDPADVARLDTTVAEVLRRFSATGMPLMLGGLSSGGTGAVRLAQACIAGRCLSGKPVGLFSVDAPLDFTRIWKGETRNIARDSPKTNIAEATMLVDELNRVFGSGPDDKAAAYARASPVTAFAPHGGNVALLRVTPVRLYAEPDIRWWIENRGVDWYALNELDAAAMINELRDLGNRNAEFIVTSGKGYRTNGQRRPHSYSIVDEADLGSWLARLVQGSAARN